jgi:hypothetical protein
MVNGPAEDRVDENEHTVLRPFAPDAASSASEPDVSDTVIKLVEPAVVARPAAESLPLPPPSLPPPPSTPVPVALHVARWAMRVRGTAVAVSLDRPAVIGRRPGDSRVTEHPLPRRVVIPATHTDVSSRHVRVEQLGESLVVSDLGSANGVVIHWSSGSNVRLRPGESCAVLPTAVIALGKNVEIEFVSADTMSLPSSLTPRPSEPS